MKKKRRRLNKRGKYMIIALLLFVLIGTSILYLVKQPLIVFSSKVVQIEIDGQFDPLAQIKKIRKGKIEDVLVDTSEINLKKLGIYQAVYSINDKQYSLDIEIVDNTPPQFTTVDGETDAGITPDVNCLIKDVVDQTKTTATFKEEYDFSKEGVLDVVIVLKDEAGNITEKTSKVKILPKDEVAPDIISEDEIVLQIGASFDPLQNIEIIDNQDPNPTLSILSNNLDTNQLGNYEILYEGKDRSGNKRTYKKSIQIVERHTIGQNYSNGENIVYLTFDDGPSYNTPKVLDILDQYNVKATFFVTGNGQEYNDCILRAHNSGHTIGLHTYSHNYSQVYSSTKNYFEDLNKIGNMVEGIIGYRPHYIRFPGGTSNEVSKQYCEGIMSILSKEVIDRGYQYYDWNLSSSDASGNNVDVQTIIQSATNDNYGNIIILFHDTYGKDTTVEALPKVIEYYQALGFRFSAITDESYTCHHRIFN